MKLIIKYSAVTAMIFVMLSVPFSVRAEKDSFGYADKYENIAENNLNVEKITLEEFFGYEADGESEDSASSQSEPQDYIREFYGTIPESVKSELPAVDGEMVTYDTFSFLYFLDCIKKTALNLVLPLRTSIIQILCVILISAAAKSLTDGSDKHMGYSVRVLCTAVVCVTVISTGTFDISKVAEYISALTETGAVLIPTVIAFLAATGKITTAAMAGQSVAFVSAGLEFLFSKLVCPLLFASAGLCFSGCVLGDKTSFSLSAIVRKASNFITVFSVTLFAFVMSVQAVLATGADGIAIRTVKFAVGSFVPLVGGAVSDTLGAVGAGLSYIKNTCGVISIVVIFLIMIPPVMSLIFGKILFFIFNFVASILDCDMEAKLFSELSSLTDCLIAVVISSSVAFIFILLWVVGCGAAATGGI